MFFALFLGALNLFKLWLARFLPLLGDEAYYSLWSRYPALSYTDHPPFIAYLHGAINFLGGQNETAIRLGAIICILIATGLIYQIGKEAFGKRVGITAAVIFNLVPTYLAGGLFLTPEQPLLIFWLLSLYWALKIAKTQQKTSWYLLGISVGLGLLSKYPMLLFIPGMLLFLLLSKENRHWLKKKEPYLALLIAFLFFFPVIFWNIQHAFPSLAHHGARIGSPHYLDNTLYFFVLQLIMYSPPLFIFTCTTFFYGFWKKIRNVDNITILFSSLSLPAFAAFLLISPLTQVGGHWTSIVYPGIIILFSHKLISARPNPLRSIRVWLNLAVAMLINVLFIGYYAFLYPIPEGLQNNAYTVNKQLAAYIREVGADHVFSNQMGVGSLVAFYGKTNAYLPKGYWKQFDLWGHPELKKGDDILYFVFDDQEMKKKLAPVFREVKEDPQKRLFIKDSDISIRTRIYICRDYKGGKLP